MDKLAKYFSVLLIFFIGVKDTFSQTKKLDSLWTIYNNKTQADTNRLSAIHNIAWRYYRNNPDTAIILAEQELKFAQQNKNKKYEGLALTTIGISNQNKGNYQRAMEYHL